MFQNIQYWDKGKIDLGCWEEDLIRMVETWDELLKLIKEVVWDKLSVSRHSPPYPGMDWWLLSHCLVNERKIIERVKKKKMWDLVVDHLTMVVHACEGGGALHMVGHTGSHHCCRTHADPHVGLVGPINIRARVFSFLTFSLLSSFSILWLPYDQKLSCFPPATGQKLFLSFTF